VRKNIPYFFGNLKKYANLKKQFSPDYFANLGNKFRIEENVNQIDQQSTANEAQKYAVKIESSPLSNTS